MSGESVDGIARGSDAGGEELARRLRLHWLCGRARGERILDAASGDGFAALLLAGEGRASVAVEREEGALDRARRELGDDAAADARVDVVSGRPGALPVEAAAFDTVLLDDPLDDPARIATALDEARRALRPGGGVAIAAPYGTSRWLDRHEPACLRPLLSTLAERDFVVDEVELADRYLGLLARAEDRADRAGGAASTADGTAVGPWLDALDAAHRRLAGRQRQLEALGRELEERDRDGAARDDELRAAKRHAGRLEGRVHRLEERVAETKRRQQEARARIDELRERLATREAELGAAREEAAQERRRLEVVRSSRSFRLVRLLWRARSVLRRRTGDEAEGSGAETGPR